MRIARADPAAHLATGASQQLPPQVGISPSWPRVIGLSLDTGDGPAVFEVDDALRPGRGHDSPADRAA